MSINTDIFPEDSKVARVTLIYKSDDKAECCNYTPISIISNIAKILEKLIYNQLPGGPKKSTPLLFHITEKLG